MFNSFHFQSECCPNYIILIPSLPCLTGMLDYHSSFNRSLIQVPSFCQVQILFLPFPTRVLYHLFNNFSFYLVFFSFLPEWFQYLPCHLTSWFSSYPRFLLSNGVFSSSFNSVV